MTKRSFDIKAQGNKARIDIIGNISDWENNSRFFNNRLRELKNQKIEDVEIYINSFGGSVFQANEIANIIVGFSGKVNIILGAVCASAATLIVSQVITQKNDVVIEQYQNGQFMIHNVQISISGEIKDLESAITLMKNLQNNAIKTYSAQTGISEKKIAQMMDKETWLTAKQALDKGFITGIINKTDTNPSNFSEITNCGFQNIPEVLNKSNINQKTKIMHKDVYNKLGLPETASDLEVVNKINELENAKKDTEQKLADFEQKTKEKEVDNFLADAVTNRKILESEKSHYAKLAENDFDTVKEIIDSKKALPKLSDNTKKTNLDNSDKTWDELTGDEQAELLNTDKEKFKTLYENKFGVVPII